MKSIKKNLFLFEFTQLFLMISTKSFFSIRYLCSHIFSVVMNPVNIFNSGHCVWVIKSILLQWKSLNVPKLKNYYANLALILYVHIGRFKRLISHKMFIGYIAFRFWIFILYFIYFIYLLLFFLKVFSPVNILIEIDFWKL